MWVVLKSLVPFQGSFFKGAVLFLGPTKGHSLTELPIFGCIKEPTEK